MAVFNEQQRACEGLLSELPGSQSREAVIMVSGAGVVRAGTVLGQITAGGKFTPSPDTGANGSQVAVAISLYEVDATSADQPVTIIRRGAEWTISDLTFQATVNDAPKRAAKIAQLAAVGILAR